MLILKLEVCISRIQSIVFNYAKLKSGRGKFATALKSFDIEFQPFIDEINAKERVIQEYADAATMERIRSMISTYALYI